MIAMKNKKAISPVIATVLLISIALVLAIIIFIWASSFITEVIQKNDEPVENSCDDIRFRAEADSSANNGDGIIFVVNEGNVPLYGLEVNVKTRGGISSGTKEYDKTGKSILSGSGENAEIDLKGSVDSGNELVLVPIILGEGKDGKVMHVCDSKFGVEVTVI